MEKWPNVESENVFGQLRIRFKVILSNIYIGKKVNKFCRCQNIGLKLKTNLKANKNSQKILKQKENVSIHKFEKIYIFL